MTTIAKPSIQRRRLAKITSGVRWIFLAESGASAVAQTLVTQVLVLGISLCTGVVSARALGVVGRGQLAAIVMWPQVLAGLFAFGIPAALIYRARRNPENEKTLFYASIILSAIASIVMIVAGELSIPHALRTYGVETVRLAQLFLFTAPQVLISYILIAHLQIRGAFRDSNAFRLLPAATTLVGLIIFSKARSLSPAIAAACYLLPSLPVFAIVLIRCFAAVRSNPFEKTAPLIASGKCILKYALRALGIDLLGTLSSQVDQLMVVSFLDPASMGAYVVALSVSRVPNVITVAMQQVVSPRTASLSPDQLTDLIGLCTRVAVFSMIVSGLALGALLPFLLPHLFGHDFERSVPSARILLAELVLTGAATILAESFKGVGRPGTVTFLQALSLASSVVLLAIFIPRYGLVGAALALLSTAALRLLALLVLYRRVVGWDAPQLILRPSDAREIITMLKIQLASRAT